MTFSASKSASIFDAIFHQTWLQKGGQKSLCAQGADRRTPGRKPANQYWWVGIWETAETANQHKSNPKWVPKVPKINENGVQNRCKIDEKSRLRRRCDFGAFRAPKNKKGVTFGDPFLEPFSAKNPQKREKKSIRSSGTVPERSKNAKKTIFERLGKRLVFWMVFSLKLAYFWRPFSMKKPSKNPC